MAKVMTFGEIMMRLNPPGYERFVQADELEVSYAGGEANVAVSLANYHHDAMFMSVVPTHEIGQCAVNALRHFGVDTSNMLRQGSRLGVYFVEKGASQRGSKVIYDRAYSAIAQSKSENYDWASILAGIDWFHFSGITPALGGALPEICEDALQAARDLGITISCDLNYRGNLWNRETAGKVMSKLMPYVNLLIANEEDTNDVFSIASEGTDIVGGKLNLGGYQSVARQLTDRFGFDQVAITLRGSISASENDWSGMLYSRGTAYFSKQYRIHIVDRVGGGDSFCGGLIHALLSGKQPQDAIEFAAAASCLKQTIEHDFNLVSEDEVMKLVKGNASGRVQR